MNDTVIRERALLMLLALTAAAAATLALLVPAAAGPTGEPGGFVDLLVRGCAAAGAAGVAWWWLGSTWLVLAALRAGAAADRPRLALGLPSRARRVVLAGCGLVLASGAAPAGATTTPPPDPGPAATAPAWAHQAAATLEGPTGRPGRAPAVWPDRAVVVVAPGDCLWTIAARHLRAVGVPADDAAVAAHWRAIHAANAARVGPDPDLLLPGTRLVLPAAT